MSVDFQSDTSRIKSAEPSSMQREINTKTEAQEPWVDLLRHLLPDNALQDNHYPNTVFGLTSFFSSGKRSARKEKHNTAVHIFVISSEGHNGMYRLLLYVFRRLLIILACKRMRREGTNPIGAFALYPSRAHASLLYEIGTPAARYAESNLIVTPRARATRLINGILNRLFRSSPFVETIVVVSQA